MSGEKLNKKNTANDGWAKLEKLADEYDHKERPRIERLKSELPYSEKRVEEYEKRQILASPSAIKKAIRLATDKVGIKTKRGEDRRNREAMHIALSEYRKERAQEQQKREQLEREQKQMQEEHERFKHENEERQAEISKRLFVENMERAHDIAEIRKRERIERQRIQEIVERDLNNRLLKVEDLEMELLSKNPEVRKHTTSYDGATISIYDLKGLPFSMLSTTIDYKIEENGPGLLGEETAKAILENPAIWVERLDEAQKAIGFGTESVHSRGNKISTSYCNSGKNIDKRVSGDLVYGFEKVDADSIISISPGDGCTGVMGGSKETELMDADAIENLENSETASFYNEIMLRRYSENGIPKRPDYIIIENGKMTEASLRHAKFFDIPIINVERSKYEKADE